MMSIQENIHKHMNTFCLEIGSKHCGSPELDKAGEYVQEYFSSLGLDTVREEMPVVGWDYRGFKLWNVTDNREVPAATACYFSNSVEIYDTLLWITEDNLAELDTLDVTGRLCMVAVWYDMGNVFGYNGLAEKLDRKGAAGAIFLNRIHSQLAPSTKIERSPFLEKLGVAAVAHEGAIYIANHPNDTYFLKVDADKFDGSSFNVIGRLGNGPRKGVIGAHYDTAPLIQGAGDDISGTVTLMELARLWKEKYPKGIEGWTLDFAAFTGEEYIPDFLPIGSGDYVQRHKEENIQFLLNIDDSSPFYSHFDLVVGRGNKLPKLDTRRKIVASDFSGDDKSFNAIGVPTVWLAARKLFNELHTPLDDLSHTDFASIERQISEYDDLLTQLTDLDRWAAKEKGTLTIRPAAEADRERMAEIGIAAWKPIYEGYEKQLGSELFHQFYPDPAARKRRNVLHEAEILPCFVGEIEGKIVAFASCRIEGTVGEIMGNAVDPAYAGCGYGGRMQEYLLDYMRGQGCTHAVVETGLDEAHAPARRAYEKNGFTKNLPSVKYFRKL